MYKIIIVSIFFFPLIIQAQTSSDPGSVTCSHEGHECHYTHEQSKRDWEALRPLREQFMPADDRAPAAPPVLSWPLRTSIEVFSPGYYVMSNQVDLDPGPGLLDYSGGTRTYNGHSGIDIRLWPFYWTLMENDMVEVIAAADGIIINKVDGNFDKNCSPNGASNRIDILHDGGYSTLYVHLKSGSLTSKGVGDFVSKGEFLGIVGSSGGSTNPHLHFQVNDDMGNAVEPYAGPSNPGVPNSLWDVQKPYYESSIVRVMTHALPPVFNNCPIPTDVPNEKNHFLPGDNIFFGTSFMSPQIGHMANYEVRDPTGALVWSWNTVFNANFARNAQNLNSQTIPLNPPYGTWEFKVTFSGNGQVESHHFTVGCTPNYIMNVNHQDDDGYIAENSIISSSNIGANDHRVHYEAGAFIALTPGFEALSGCSFRTKIDDCSPGGQ